MTYQISKYEAIKAVLKAEENQNDKLASKMMQAIRRAARQEIKCNIYTKFYVINENEKKYFEQVSVYLFSNEDDN